MRTEAGATALPLGGSGSSANVALADHSSQANAAPRLRLRRTTTRVSSRMDRGSNAWRCGRLRWQAKRAARWCVRPNRRAQMHRKRKRRNPGQCAVVDPRRCSSSVTLSRPAGCASFDRAEPGRLSRLHIWQRRVRRRRGRDPVAPQCRAAILCKVIQEIDIARTPANVPQYAGWRREGRACTSIGNVHSVLPESATG
jgi:hypothetical protein